jgi:putative hydrolase of the HAD superfamily
MPEKYMFLDLDDTFYDYKSAHKPAQTELVAYLSRQLKLDTRAVSAGLLSSRLKVKERLGASASSHSRLIYISEYLREVDCQTHVELTLSAESLYWNTFLKNMKIFEGVHNFLLSSRQDGFTNVLVTDLTASIQRRKLRLLEIDTLFEIVLTSEEAGGDKVSGLPEKFLGDLLGDFQGICIGDSDSDHLFKNQTIFYKKGLRNRIRNLNAGGEFKSFPRLQQELF